MELQYDCLARTARDVASTGANRCDILTIMPDGRIVGLDVVVTHASAPSYVRRAADDTGHAAEQRATAKHRDFHDL